MVSKGILSSEEITLDIKFAPWPIAMRISGGSDNADIRYAISRLRIIASSIVMNNLSCVLANFFIMLASSEMILPFVSILLRSILDPSTA